MCTKNDKALYPRKPMNLLFIFSDQHSKKILGAYGNRQVHTPNLDRLAREGTTFENAYTPCPICVPARAAMASGEYCFRNGYWDNAHPYAGAEKSWGHRLTGAGCEVVTIGKLHFQSQEADTGYPEQHFPMHVIRGVGAVTDVIRDGTFDRSWFADGIRNAGEGTSDYLRYDERVATDAVSFLEQHAGGQNEKPWCLFTGFATPHTPWKVPKEILDLYHPFDQLPFPKQWHWEDRPDHPALDLMRTEMGIDRDCGITDEQVRQAVAAYYGMVTYTDQQIGRVLQALRDTGLDQNTRIIYASDHGDVALDHRLSNKHNMYDGSASVPLIIAGPDIPRGRRVKEGVSLLDMFPTVLECTGVKPEPEDLGKPGVSLWDYPQNTPGAQERVIFSEYHTVGTQNALFMIRYRNFKYVDYEGFPPMLFDLEKDPEELCDLAADPAYRDILDDLKKKLRDICDPEAVDRQAKKSQMALLEKYGGREGAKAYEVISCTPVPEGSV